jgi:hypothetical protein
MGRPTDPQQSEPNATDDSVYRLAIQKYLCFLGAACVIASIVAGPGMIVVWVITALALTASDWLPQATQQRTTRCPKRRGRC